MDPLDHQVNPTQRHKETHDDFSRPLVADVKHGTINTIITTTNDERLIVRGSADVVVERLVPTAGEVAIEEARKEAERRVWIRERLFRRATDAYNAPFEIRSKIAEKAASSAAWRVTSDLHDLVQKLQEADTTWECWLEVLHRTGVDGQDIVSAHEQALEVVKADIVSRGPDDTWSGRSNDIRRVAFDAKREFARGHWY